LLVLLEEVVFLKSLRLEDSVVRMVLQMPREMITFLVLEVIIAVVDKMKKDNLGGFALGLLGLAVSVYVIGYAWRASQRKKTEVLSVSKGDGGSSIAFDGVYN
jgi:hypothetical protein